jgi:hypothetical protein
MIGYLDYLIGEEHNDKKVKAYKDRLQALEEYRNEYEQRIQVLDQKMALGNEEDLLTEEGVENLVKHLYWLKHYKQNLKDLKFGTKAASLATYHEQTYRVSKRKKNWGSSWWH